MACLAHDVLLDLLRDNLVVVRYEKIATASTSPVIVLASELEYARSVSRSYFASVSLKAMAAASPGRKLRKSPGRLGRTGALGSHLGDGKASLCL